MSSILKAPPPKITNKIQLPSLSQEFEKSEKTDLPSWRNKQTGVRIGVFSDCDNPDARLSDAHHIVSDSLENQKQLNETVETISNRKYYMKSFKGEIESSPIEVETAAFRIDDCVILSSISGHPGRITNHKKEWTEFLQRIEFRK